MTEETFGERLRRLRTARGLRLRDLGPPSSIAQYEAGTRIPRSPRVVAKLASALDVPVDTLLTTLPSRCRGFTQNMHEVLSLASQDAQAALAESLAQRNTAIRHGATEEIWLWDHVVSRLARQTTNMLSIDVDGRIDFASALDLGCRWLANDHWQEAALLFESLRPHVPFVSPYFGRLAHNAAIAYSALGLSDEAIGWNTASLNWGLSQADGWWVLLASGVTVSLAWEDPQHEPMFQKALGILEDWRKPDGRPDPLALTWADNARASAALARGQLAEARHWIQRLTQRLQVEEAVQPEAVNIAEVQAQALAIEGKPAAALEEVDRALANAQDMPSYALIPAWMTSVSLALALAAPDAEMRWTWLTVRLACGGARGQLNRLSQRTGRPADIHVQHLPPWILRVPVGRE